MEIIVWFNEYFELLVKLSNEFKPFEVPPYNEAQTLFCRKPKCIYINQYVLRVWFESFMINPGVLTKTRETTLSLASRLKSTLQNNIT